MSGEKWMEKLADKNLMKATLVPAGDKLAGK